MAKQLFIYEYIDYTDVDGTLTSDNHITIPPINIDTVIIFITDRVAKRKWC